VTLLSVRAQSKFSFVSTHQPATKPCLINGLAMTFQLLLPAFDATVDLESQSNKGPAGCNRQSLYVETDAIARNQSQQLPLFAIAPEKARYAMEAKQLRGLDIAANQEIVREGNVWIVPSQTSSKKYIVNLFIQTCTCPDFEKHRLKCKHIYAADYQLQRESGATIPTPEKLVKPTYRQEWHAYNLAQVNEKAKFQILLAELCKGIEEPVQTYGRPRLPLSDILFAACFKVYSTISCRRFNTDLREAHEKGYLTKRPSYNSIFDYFQMPMLAPYLKQMIEESSKPLASVEMSFAVDSSGFSTRRYERWLHAKYSKGQVIDKQTWLKAHLICGVKTNIVTAVDISDGTAGDSPYFKPLVEATARNFVMNEVSGDKAYLSDTNLKVVLLNGAQPYIPFKSNSNAEDPRQSSIWKRMFHFYMYNQDWYMQQYHKRSNVESTFSMIKAKFGDHLRSKIERAQVNEALAKVLCHNLCCVIQSIYELGIDPTFWPDEL
jgi:transposase